MKAKDIEPGVVYGYRRSKYDKVMPVVFLTPVDADHVYRNADRFAKAGTPAFAKARSGIKPKLGTGYASVTYGYPVVTSYGQVDVEALTSVTLDEFEATTSVYRSERSIEFRLVTSLGHVLGPWADAVAAEKAAAAKARAELDREVNARRVALERARSLQATLGELGAKATLGNDWHPETLVLSLDDVEKLLALLGQSSPSQGSESRG